MPDANTPVVNIFGPSKTATISSPALWQLSRASRINPLIDAVHNAFAQHRPLALSPDAIWLTIEQGFAHHISDNAELFRHRLVNHEGKRELVEKISNLSFEEFQRAVSRLSAQIREATDPVLHETLICNFSTTTPHIRTASEIVLMDTYASYFEYAMMFVCGIPKITLKGTLEDWQRIRARIEVLETFDLDWWICRLRPIVDEFINTAQGRPNLRFWQAIYIPKETYGTSTITGWIADLFPYLGDAPDRHRNHIFEHKREDWALPVEKGVKTVGRFDPGARKGVAPKRFPSGLSSVPFTLRFPDKSDQKLDLVGGFLAVEQDADLTLAPLIGWAVTEAAPDEPLTVR